MRKIIDGKSYDTGKAELIGEYESEFGRSDFKWFREELYRKRTGEYFIYGEGHAQSRYAKQAHGMWGAGEAITPMSYDGARKWAEEHLGAEGYEREFGCADDDDGTKVVASYRISAAARTAIQREAARTGLSLGEVVERLAATLGE